MVVIAIPFCFNPLQVGYKPLAKAPGSSLFVAFQSLIGWLQTAPELLYQVQKSKVSIPYRLATNLLKVIVNFPMEEVSIPYRLATNLLLSSPFSLKEYCFNPLQVGYKHGLMQERFCLLHGFNPLQVGYKHIKTEQQQQQGQRVSIPYRLATNKRKKAERKEEFYKFQSLIGWLQTIF